MATFTKSELKQLSSMSDANFCFCVCEKLLQNQVHINGNTIVSEAGQEYEFSVENIKYFIERLLFQSSRTFRHIRDIDELVKKHTYIFQYELASSDALATMLGA